MKSSIMIATKEQQIETLKAQIEQLKADGAVNMVAQFEKQLKKLLKSV